MLYTNNYYAVFTLTLQRHDSNIKYSLHIVYSMYYIHLHHIQVINTDALSVSRNLFSDF